MVSRMSVLVATVVGATACALSPIPDLAPIWLRISSSAEGIEYYVGDELVAREQLEQALLDHAVAANPGLSPEQARAEVLIYVRIDPEVSTDAVGETYPLLLRFGRVGLVGEDLR